MLPYIDLQPDTEISEDVLLSETHNIRLRSDKENGDVYIECSSREALFEFAKSLMSEALYGVGQAEFYPLIQNNKALVVNGARFTEDSSRLFVFYPENQKQWVSPKSTA